MSTTFPATTSEQREFVSWVQSTRKHDRCVLETQVLDDGYMYLGESDPCSTTLNCLISPEGKIKRSVYFFMEGDRLLDSGLLSRAQEKVLAQIEKEEEVVKTYLKVDEKGYPSLSIETFDEGNDQQFYSVSEEGLIWACLSGGNVCGAHYPGASYEDVHAAYRWDCRQYANAYTTDAFVHQEALKRLEDAEPEKSRARLEAACKKLGIPVPN